MSRKAVITLTPDEENKADIQTGNVSDLEIYQALTILTKVFGERICVDAEEVVGDYPVKQKEYIDWRIRESGING